jgi:hypothetical protein
MVASGRGMCTAAPCGSDQRLIADDIIPAETATATSQPPNIAVRFAIPLNKLNSESSLTSTRRTSTV